MKPADEYLDKRAAAIIADLATRRIPWTEESVRAAVREATATAYADGWEARRSAEDRVDPDRTVLRTELASKLAARLDPQAIRSRYHNGGNDHLGLAVIAALAQFEQQRRIADALETLAERSEPIASLAAHLREEVEQEKADEIERRADRIGR
jgi:AraC-like DNA-binding protein